MLKLLFIADVIGSPGRKVVKALLPELRRRHDIGLVICNGENSAGGFGLTREGAAEMFAAGVDVLTGGNHLWDKKESHSYLAEAAGRVLAVADHEADVVAPAQLGQ